MPLLLALALLLPGFSQIARRASQGPRALAILEFDGTGQAHIVPVVVMINGEFYDAEVYKASPVPMALEDGTVYEGLRTGISQGFFTVKRAHQVLGTWTGEGGWEPAGSVKPKKKTPLAPVEEKEGPPVLKRGGSAKAPATTSTPDKPAEPKAPEQTPKTPAQGSTLKLGEKEHIEPVEPNERPTLRRGKPEATEEQGPTLPATTRAVPVLSYPAISDATQLDVHSYLYVMRPDEEESLRKHMLDLATQEMQKQNGASKTKAKPDFEDVQVRAFDVSTNNEPVFVLTTKVRQPGSAPGVELWQYVTLVARRDIYSEFHTAFFRFTDTRHLDISPRFEVIDAVDAEGNGYGDLLFRTVTDTGHGFSLYRVIGNRLWPLYEGKPQ